MKKQLAIGVGLAILSTSAFASKARLDALGEDSRDGSFYIQDTRSVFGNPAYVTNFKDYVLVELGSDVATDAITAPNAEGGFFRSWGNFSYGLYLGDDFDAFERQSAGFDITAAGQNVAAASSPLAPDNRWELFFGGDSGVQWGASFYYNHSSADNGPGTSDTDGNIVLRKNTAYGLSLGAIVGNIEGYANFDIHDESEGATHKNDKFDADLGYKVGASYATHGWTFAGEYNKRGYEYTPADPSGNGTTGGSDNFSNRDHSRKEWWLAAGRTTEINDKARWFTDITFDRTKVEEKYARVNTTVATNDRIPTTTNRPTKTTTYSLPLSIALEADATSWLTLRGSVAQNIYQTSVSAGSVRTSGTGATTVVAGATLNFGQLKVDGMIGNDAAGAGTGAGGATSTGGTLRLDSLLSRVAVHYWF